MDEKIKLDKMLYKSLCDNKIISISILGILAGHWLQDVLFSRSFSKVLANIPEFAQNISFSSILVIVFPYIVANFMFYISDIIESKVFPKIEMDILHKLMNDILNSIKTVKTEVNINELILNFKNILDVKNIYSLGTVYILPTIIIGFALIYYFFTANIKTGFIVVISMLVFIMFSVRLEDTCVRTTKDYESEINKLYDEIQDLMNNNDTIITSNTQNKELCQIKKTQDKCSSKHEISEFKSGEVSFSLSTMSMLFMLLLDAIAIKLYYGGHMRDDMLISVCMMSYTFINYYNSSIYKFKSVLHYIGKYRELIEYFNKFKLKTNLENKEIQLYKGKINFTNVQVIHQDKLMNNKLNFTIEGGTKVGIVGEIGTGKTSILKILAGLKKYKGRVMIDDQDMESCSHESLMKHIIYIPQHPKLFNRTIWENLAYGTELTYQDIKKEVLKLKLEKFFTKFADGINSNVGKEGSKLSGGQKQIMALIRAIIQRKSIILLDEPTSSLDSETKKIFISLIESIIDRTIITVTHDKTIHNLFDDFIEL